MQCTQLRNPGALKCTEEIKNKKKKKKKRTVRQEENDDQKPCEEIFSRTT